MLNKKTDGVWEQGAEENIWTSDGGNTEKLIEFS
jgi:hypothetical protein